MSRPQLAALFAGLVITPAAVPALLRAQDHGHAEHLAMAPRLGTVTFPNSGARTAQRPFLRGIALLHSYIYDEAADAFRQAERADAGFALAYWMEALTYSHPVWGEDDPAAARRALAKLGSSPNERLAKARTARERAYGAAIEAFYADSGLTARARAFADSMTSVATHWPDDLEAAAFAANALVASVYVGRPADTQRKADEEKAVTFAERVFRANPDHPGAAHYLLHVSDVDASFAERALPAARAYAQIAPDAEHALHMPSHVFLKLGMWDDVASSNERAWAASHASVKKHSLPNTELDFHDFEWLQYAYLEQGRWRAARALVDTARALLAGLETTTSEHVDAHYVVPLVEFAFATETGRWEEAPSDAPATSPVGPPSGASRERSFILASNYGRALRAAMRGDSAAANTAVNALSGAPGAPPLMRNASGGMLALVVRALLARARGDTAGAIALLRQAAPLNDRLGVVGPPLGPPVRELLGALLLESGQARDAAVEYEHALAYRPNRSASLLGLARARKAIGDSAGAAETYRKLLANWKHADPDLPALAEVRAGAAGSASSGRD